MEEGNEEHEVRNEEKRQQRSRGNTVTSNHEECDDKEDERGQDPGGASPWRKLQPIHINTCCIYSHSLTGTCALIYLNVFALREQDREGTPKVLLKVTEPVR